MVTLLKEGNLFQHLGNPYLPQTKLSQTLVLAGNADSATTCRSINRNVRPVRRFRPWLVSRGPGNRRTTNHRPSTFAFDLVARPIKLVECNKEQHMRTWECLCARPLLPSETPKSALDPLCCPLPCIPAESHFRHGWTRQLDPDSD